VSDTLDWVAFNDDGTYYMVPGHMTGPQMLRALICEEHEFIEEIEEPWQEECEHCEGDGCGLCGDLGYTVPRRTAMLAWCRRAWTSYGRFVEDREFGEDYWDECGPDAPGAVPVTIYEKP
jgi:hypothetical protein